MPKKRGFILFGSPHQNGATARLVQAFLKAFPEETEWTMVEAYHQKIAPCLGCGLCEHKEGCVNSDFDQIDHLLRTCDYLVVASPVYNLSFPAPLKAILTGPNGIFPLGLCGEKGRPSLSIKSGYASHLRR